MATKELLVEFKEQASEQIEQLTRVRARMQAQLDEIDQKIAELSAKHGDIEVAVADVELAEIAAAELKG